MSAFQIPLQVRWADLDPNFHLRHSVYYDWATMCRLSYLSQNGLTPAVMQQLQFGPVLFREECVFKKEIHFGDALFITIRIQKCRSDYSRWSIVHDIIKQDGTLCAIVTVEGAWLHLAQRKLCAPPALVKEIFEKMPLDENFQWAE